MRKLVEGAGGKFVNFYFTTGETDFLLIAEAEEAENLIPALNDSGGRAYHFRCLVCKGLDRCGVQDNCYQRF